MPWHMLWFLWYNSVIFFLLARRFLLAAVAVVSQSKQRIWRSQIRSDELPAPVFIFAHPLMLTNGCRGSELTHAAAEQACPLWDIEAALFTQLSLVPQRKQTKRRHVFKPLFPRADPVSGRQTEDIYVVSALPCPVEQTWDIWCMCMIRFLS